MNSISNPLGLQDYKGHVVVGRFYIVAVEHVAHNNHKGIDQLLLVHHRDWNYCSAQQRQYLAIAGCGG